jgi:hypothetical protein
MLSTPSRIAVIAAFLLALAGAAPALDLHLLPADTQWLVHVDARQTLSGDLGNWIRSSIEQSKDKAKLDALVVMTGFDPFSDLANVVICGSSLEQHDAICYVEGRFDQQRLVTLVKAANDYEAMAHGTRTIHHWTNEGKKQGPVFASFLNDGTLAIGSGLTAIEHALDAGDAKIPTLSDPPSPTGNGLVLFAQADAIHRLAGADPKAAMLKRIVKSFLTLSEQASSLRGELVLTADTATSADQILKLAQGLQALAMLNQEQEKDPVAKMLIGNLAIALDGAAVRISTSCPVQLLRDQNHGQMLHALRGLNRNAQSSK